MYQVNRRRQFCLNLAMLLIAASAQRLARAEDPASCPASEPQQWRPARRATHGQAATPPPAPSPATAGPDCVNLHFDDVDVRKALELLSRETKLQLLVAPNVSGRISGNVQGVTPNEALDAILSVCNLIARHDKNIIYVHTP